MSEPRIDLTGYNQSWFDRGRPGWFVILWDIAWLLLLRPCPQPFYAWKRIVWRCFGARIGRGVLLRSTVRCNYPWKVTIGDHAWIGEEVWLYALEQITIGAHAVISQQTYLCTGSHDLQDVHFSLKIASITIGDGAWIALRAVIMPGLTIGAGAVISANALLTKDAQPWTIYRGTPAVPCGQRTLNPQPVSAAPASER